MVLLRWLTLLSVRCGIWAIAGQATRTPRECSGANRPDHGVSHVLFACLNPDSGQDCRLHPSGVRNDSLPGGRHERG